MYSDVRQSKTAAQVARFAQARVAGATLAQAARAAGLAPSRQSGWNFEAKHRTAVEAEVSRLLNNVADQIESATRTALEVFEKQCRDGDLDGNLASVVKGILTSAAKPDEKTVRVESTSATLSLDAEVEAQVQKLHERLGYARLPAAPQD